MPTISGGDFYISMFNSIATSVAGSAAITAIQTVAYSILVLSFLLAVYGAFFNGGSLAAFGKALAIYVVVGVVIANWSTVFGEAVNTSNSVAASIYQAGGGLDVYKKWANDLAAQQSTDQSLAQKVQEFVTVDIVATISTVALLIATIVYYVGMLLFALAYSVWGLMLFALGPLFLAGLPSGATSGYSKSYIKATIEWLLWPVLYHVLGALIVATNLNNISQFQGTGTNALTAIVGTIQGVTALYYIAAITIIFAVVLLILPFVAHHLVGVNFSGAASSVISAAQTVAGLGAGVARGASAAGAVARSAGAAGGASAGGGTTSPPQSSGAAAAAGGSGATAAPPPPSVAGSMVRGGLVGGAAAAVAAAVGRTGSRIAAAGATAGANSVRVKAPAAPPPPTKDSGE